MGRIDRVWYRTEFLRDGPEPAGVTGSHDQSVALREEPRERKEPIPPVAPNTEYTGLVLIQSPSMIRRVKTIATLIVPHNTQPQIRSAIVMRKVHFSMTARLVRS